MSLAAMDALSSSIFISRIPYGNMNDSVVQLPEFAVQPSNNQIGTLKINQIFNLSLWVSSSQRIGPSGSRVLDISKDVSREGTENLGSNNGHNSIFEDIVSVGEFLVDYGLYEPKDEAVKRQEVLGKLDEIVKLWVKNVSNAKGYNDQVVEESNAKILLDELDCLGNSARPLCYPLTSRLLARYTLLVLLWQVSPSAVKSQTTLNSRLRGGRYLRDLHMEGVVVRAEDKVQAPHLLPSIRDGSELTNMKSLVRKIRFELNYCP